MMKKIGITLVGLFVLFLGITSLIPDNENYHLSIVNSFDAAAEVTVAPSGETWTVPAGGAVTVVVGKESDRKNSPTQTFTVKSGGSESTIEGSVSAWGQFILDLTGDSCLIAADYGRLYRPDDKALPEGESDIVIIDMARSSQQFFAQPKFSYDGLPYEDKTLSSYKVDLGEALPDRIESSYSSDFPVLTRLINVPCDQTADGYALYQYLANN